MKCPLALLNKKDAKMASVQILQCLEKGSIISRNI